MLALNLYTTPSNNGGIVLYMDADLGDLKNGTFYAKTEFFDIVIRSEYPPEHFCIIFFS